MEAGHIPASVVGQVGRHAVAQVRIRGRPALRDSQRQRQPTRLAIPEEETPDDSPRRGGSTRHASTPATSRIAPTANAASVRREPWCGNRGDRQTLPSALSRRSGQDRFELGDQLLGALPPIGGPILQCTASPRRPAPAAWPAGGWRPARRVRGHVRRQDLLLGGPGEGRLSRQQLVRHHAEARRGRAFRR